MYFLRLAKLKPAVEEIAEEAWNDFEVRLTSSQDSQITNSESIR